MSFARRMPTSTFACCDAHDASCSYMYTLWHTWGLKPVVAAILAVHVLVGAWFVLELTLAVVSPPS